MEAMKLTILGCNSALPAINRFQTSQILHFREKKFMIDCGEGAQIRLRQQNIKPSRLNHIFISHLHGDHVFGLIGFISSLGMLGRTADLEIHAHPDLEKLLQPQIDYYCSEINFKVLFHPLNPRKHALIYEDKSLNVYSLPLKHRVPTCGFLFEEKEKPRHMIRAMIDQYHIPLNKIPDIKLGANFITQDGEEIPNDQLTQSAEKPKKYAYCSDTAFSKRLIPWIKEVDVLYHEATFLHADIVRAKATGHSSALQAAEIACEANVGQLIIGHYSARYDNIEALLAEAQTIFPHTILAYDGLNLNI
ncbi:MAG: ribonuclease Z [Microbacter sp.]